MKTQLNRGLTRRIMYVENKNGTIDGVAGRVGWVTSSRTGQTVYYRDLTLTKAKGGGIRGNFLNRVSGEEYWVSGIKRRGTNAHHAEPVAIEVDADALAGYRALKRA